MNKFSSKIIHNIEHIRIRRREEEKKKRYVNVNIILAFFKWDVMCIYSKFFARVTQI